MRIALVAALAVLGVGACQEQAPPPAAEPAAPAAAAAVPAIEGVGVVASIDLNASALTLNHEALPAINWPAMTMGFAVDDPGLLQGLNVGDRVAFTLKSARETTIITSLRKL